MTQVVKSEEATLAIGTDTTALRHATSESSKTKKVVSPAGEILRKTTAAYTEKELANLLGEFHVISHHDNGNPDVIEYNIDALGLSTEARPIDRKHVEELIDSDETTWDHLVVSFWPSYLPNPDSALLRVLSGNHRVTAAREKDEPIERLRMRVLKIEQEIDFRILAIHFNVSHGQNFSDDQRRTQAAYLKQEGQTLAAIAAILCVNKSTVSRWLTGTDSNASRKVVQQATSEMKKVLNDSNAIRTDMDPAQQKVMGLLLDAKLSGDIGSARAYIRTLKPEQRRLLQDLQTWLVMALED